MKRLLIASLLSLGLVAGVQAQDAEPHHFKPDGSRIAKKLDITESQLPAYQAVMQAQMEKRRALHEQFRQQNEALEAETRQELAGVLTPEQLEKLAALKEDRREIWKRHHKQKKERCKPGSHNPAAEE